MNEDYIKMIEIINDSISKFNEFLSPNYQIPLIDLSKIDDNKQFTRLRGTTWRDLALPNATKRGVYFIFGHDSQDVSLKSAYIGKASYGSSMGIRMHNHLVKDKNNENFTMGDLSGNIHHFEYVYGLDMESSGLAIFSSALEEFLILNVREKIKLLNGTGNLR